MSHGHISQDQVNICTRQQLSFAQEVLLYRLEPGRITGTDRLEEFGSERRQGHQIKARVVKEKRRVAGVAICFVVVLTITSHHKILLTAEKQALPHSSANQDTSFCHFLK